MPFSRERSISRRSFCLCCVGAAAYTATGGWLTPREAFAEARGLVSLFKDSAAVSQITTHKLRDNISVLEGSGGNIAVLTGPDGKVLIDGGIGASRTQITKALADLGADPITHLVNTHWHFDHTSSNEWLHAAGAKIIAQENTHKYLSEFQRVEDWDYNFLPLSPGGVPTEVFATEHSLKLNGATIGLKRYTPAHTDSDISVTFGEADPLRRAEWVVYAKRLFGGQQAVLSYLSRYTQRVAIANSRLIACDRNGVTFRWKDYRAKGPDRQKVMTLATAEFIRRFLIHVLPHGFHRIRHYGLLASGTRADNIAQARRLLDVPAAQPEAAVTCGAEASAPKPP